FNSEASVNDSASVLDNRSAGENRAISHFINTTIPHDFALCLKVEADGLKGLIAQAACHAPPTLDQVTFDQLVMAVILAKNDNKSLSTFVGQVILNASLKAEDFSRNLSPFVYHMADAAQIVPPLHTAAPSSSMVHQPPEHLVDKFREACFHCRQHGHWQVDCPQTNGVANLNPHPRSPSPFPQSKAHTPEPQSPLMSNSRFHPEWVSQVQFVECHATDKVLIDSGASIHLSGSYCFTSNLCSINPFKKNFTDSNSSITIAQMVTLKLPFKHGYIVIHDIAFSKQISGTMLSVG
ncbi:hypothetical protein O181_079149, partial [Austropuccinia psidii MF-1]|nr:hypothetical protein [Austropuccinia psidii MF-1]